MKKINMLKLNLQHFAEDVDELENQDKDELENEDGQQGTDKTFTQEEFNKKLESELTRRLKQKEQEKNDAIEEAKKLAKMNKDQRAEHERKQMEQELEQLRAEKAQSEMKSEASKMLQESKITPTENIINLVLADSAEKTSENVNTFVSVLNETVKAQVKDSLRQSTPAASTSTGLTRADIMSIKDDSKRQRAIAQNRHLFN